jgi:pSer/pThr/pTyr-binding forkhead associated (FHA) protein
VSRHHCSIVKDPAGWTLVDGGSNNGTFVGGKKVGRHLLKDGERIVLGKHSLVYDANGFASATKAPKKAGAGSMGGEMTMFVDQSALAKAMAEGGKRMVISLDQGGREVLAQLMREETTVGTLADIPAKGFLVKAVQARITKTTNGHRIRSEGGWRAVKVNGEKIAGDRELKAGDIITIAGARLTYKQA